MLAIITDCACLGPDYQAGGTIVEIALSAGLTDDTGTDADLEGCLPWSWQPIAAWHLYLIDAAGAAHTVPVMRTLPPLLNTGPITDDWSNRMTGHVKRQRGRADNAGQFLRWSPLAQPSAQWADLASVMAEMGRWPRLGRYAGLTHHVVVAAQDLQAAGAAAGLIAVPEIVLNDVTRLVPGQLLVDPAVTADLGPALAWSYKPPNQLRARAFALKREVAPPSDLTLIDLKSHWIAAPACAAGEHSWHGNDYTVEMPFRVAEGLTLVRALDTVLQAAATAGTDLAGLAQTAGAPTNWLPKAVRMALLEASCHLTAPGLDGMAALDILLGTTSTVDLGPDSGKWPGRRKALLASVRQALQAFEQRMHQPGTRTDPNAAADELIWRAALNEALCASADVPAVQQSGKPIGLAADMLAELLDGSETPPLAKIAGDLTWLNGTLADDSFLPRYARAITFQLLDKRADLVSVPALTVRSPAAARRAVLLAAAGEDTRTVLRAGDGHLSGPGYRAVFKATLALVWKNRARPLLDLVRDAFGETPQADAAIAAALDTEAALHADQRVLPPADVVTAAVGANANFWQNLRAEIGDDSPAEAPHALVFPVDRLHAEAPPASGADAGQTDTDALRRIAGFGVLIRQLKADAGNPLNPEPARNPPGPPSGQNDFDFWRCMNMANVYLRGPSEDDAQWQQLNLEADTDLATALACVPHSVGFNASVTQPLVSYNSRPLIAEDPIAAPYDDAGNSPVTADHPDTTRKADMPPALRFGPALDRRNAATMDPRGKLPRLRFGQVYEIAAFVASSGGGLPAELTRTGAGAAPAHPAELGPLTDLLVPDAPDRPIIRRLRYLRRVRVGEPRLAPAGSPSASVKRPFGPVDMGVRALAAEIETPGRAAGLDPANPTVWFFGDEFGTRGDLDLSDGDFGFELLAIDTTDLGATDQLAVEIVQPGGAVLGRLTVTRSGTVVAARVTGASRSPAGAGPPQPLMVQIDLAGFPAGAAQRPLVDLLINPKPSRYRGFTPEAGAPEWRLLLRPSGGALWDRAKEVITAEVPRVDLARGPMMPVPDATWRGLAVRLTLAGAGRVAFGRPTARLGQSRKAADGKSEVSLIFLGDRDAASPANQIALDRVQSFKLRLPGVDGITWDRWIAMDRWRTAPVGPSGLPAGDVARRADRVAVHLQVVEASERIAIQQNAPDAQAGDAILDDPAVSQTLYFVLTPLLSAQNRAALTLFAQVPAPSWNSGVIYDPEQPEAFLDTLRCGALPLQIGCTADAAPSLAQVQNSTVTVALPPGEIWELSVETLVHQDWFLTVMPDGTVPDSAKWGRFPHRVRAGLPLCQSNGETYVRMSPARLRIETVSTKMPDAQALFKMLSAGFDGHAMVASWSQPTAVPLMALEGLANLGRVDLLRQSWRWDGRPFAPAGAGMTERAVLEALFGPQDQDSGLLKAWTRWAFADRVAADHQQSAVATGLFPVASELFRQDLDGDPRADVQRFAVRAHSRYEPLMTRNAPADARDGVLAAPVQQAQLSSPAAWLVAIVPTRIVKKPPKPAVKLVVPLTQADGADAAAGLLVLLDEPWFQIAGLGELLDVPLIARASVPPGGQDGQTEVTGLDELGPDPIVGNAAFADDQKLNFDVEGPIGHSREDPDSGFRTFRTTSFILKPNWTGEAESLPWTFVKFALRRIVLGAARTPAGALPAPDLASDYTAADWHQLLPGSSHFRYRAAPPPAPLAGPIDITKTRVRTINGLQFLYGDLPIVPWPARSGGYNAFGLWVLLTRRVYTAAGTLAGERYAGLFEYDTTAGSWATLDAPALQSIDGPALARLIEVQFQVATGDAAADDYRRAPAGNWDKLFPTDNKTDVAARIVRVSPPIRSL